MCDCSGPLFAQLVDRIEMLDITEDQPPHVHCKEKHIAQRIDDSSETIYTARHRRPRPELVVGEKLLHRREHFSRLFAAACLPSLVLLFPAAEPFFCRSQCSRLHTIRYRQHFASSRRIRLSIVLRFCPKRNERPNEKRDTGRGAVAGTRGVCRGERKTARGRGTASGQCPSLETASTM